MKSFQVCHSFSPNSESDIFCHPRFGMIRCIATTRAVRAGQEITINYGCEPFFKKVNFRLILFVIVAQLCTHFMDILLQLQSVNCSDLVQGGLGQAPEGGQRSARLEVRKKLKNVLRNFF